MNFNDYQEKAKSFRLASANETYVILGLVGEVGELYGAIAKNIRDEKELDYPHVIKELGDILWFLSALCDDLGLTLEDVAQENIIKLDKRLVAGTLQGSGDDR